MYKYENPSCLCCKITIFEKIYGLTVILSYKLTCRLPYKSHNQLLILFTLMSSITFANYKSTGLLVGSN